MERKGQQKINKKSQNIKKTTLGGVTVMSEDIKESER